MVACGRTDWSHHEDGIARWVQQIKGPRTPVLISGRALDRDLGAPFAVVGVRVIDVERHAGVSTVAVHWTVQGQLDCSAFEAEQSDSAVLRCFECHAKAQAIDLEGLRS